MLPRNIIPTLTQQTYSLLLLIRSDTAPPALINLDENGLLQPIYLRRSRRNSSTIPFREKDQTVDLLYSHHALSFNTMPKSNSSTRTQNLKPLHAPESFLLSAELQHCTSSFPYQVVCVQIAHGGILK